MTEAIACRTAFFAIGDPGRTLKTRLRISALSDSLMRVPEPLGSRLAITLGEGSLYLAGTFDLGYAWREASCTTVMSEVAPTRTGGPHAPAPRVT
jgi:hypothetical protein